MSARAGLRLRPAEPADAAAIATLVQLSFEAYREFAPARWRPPESDDAETVSRGLARPAAWGMVALVDGEHAGHVLWVPARDSVRAADHDPGLVHLWQLFVRPEDQGSGLAARLHAEALSAAVAAGFARMRLFTPRGQARARRFYEREGWSLFRYRGIDAHLGLEILEYRRSLEGIAVQNGGA